MNTILLVNLTESQLKQGYHFDVVVERMKKFCHKNGFLVSRIFGDDEKTPVENFATIIESVAQSDLAKIIIMTYNNISLLNNAVVIQEKFRELLATQRIEIVIYSHECFEEPPDDGSQIWRYLSLPKVLDLVQTNRLFFASGSEMRVMDRKEGVPFTSMHLTIAQKVAELLKVSGPLANFMQERLNLYSFTQEYISTMVAQNENLMDRIFINCWHESNSENYAMWKIYSDNFGLCIRSDYKSLIECFADDGWSPYSKDRRIYVGRVRYIDFASSLIPQNNILWRFMHKMNEFSYEREIRCVIWDVEREFVKTCKVDIDAKKLIKALHISPFAPSWFAEVVSNVLEKYGLPATLVRQSSLAI